VFFSGQNNREEAKDVNKKKLTALCALCITATAALAFAKKKLG
jgi:hypothetical protein